MSFILIKRKTRRWPIAIFFNLVDVCGIAAEFIWENLYPDWNKTKAGSRHKLFLKNLVEELVIPNIKRRIIKGLSKSHIVAINDILQNTSANLNDDVVAEKSNTRRRCYICSSEKCRASKQICSVCKKHVCNEHSQKVVICKTCINK